MSFKKIAAGVLALGACLASFSSFQAGAHHAFGAEFDPNRPLLLKGPVVKVEWVNPHAWIHLEHTTEAGDKEVWMVEGGTPNTLLRRGLNKRSLLPGTYIIVDGYQSKDRSKRANGRDVTLAVVKRSLWDLLVQALHTIKSRNVFKISERKSQRTLAFLFQ